MTCKSANRKNRIKFTSKCVNSLMPPHDATFGRSTPTNIYKRRVLFDRSQTHPDNYIDKTFLHGLQTNVNMKMYALVDVLFNTSVITQELSSVCTCVTSFVYLDEQRLPTAFLLVSSTVIVLLLYLTFMAGFSLNRWLQDGKRAFVFLTFILGLSPILKTLTDTVSTDSIYFMAGFLMFIHLVTHDYGLTMPIVKPALSLTAAVAASVTLASRLSTAFCVFEFLVLSVELFALFPILRKRLQNRMKSLQVSLTVFLAAFSFALVWSVSPVCAILLLILEIFITIFCPILFIQWQKYKNNIYGPWDEAIIPDS